MDKSTKIIIYTCAALTAIILLYWFGSAAYSGWQGYKWQKQTDAFQEALKKPYKEDTYGGKTPEETWAMFLEALKKGDVELASRYFVVERQKKELEFLKREKEIDNLQLLIEQLTGNIKKDESVSTAETIFFTLRIKDKDTGDIQANSVVFILNNYTKIWKISAL